MAAAERVSDRCRDRIQGRDRLPPKHPCQRAPALKSSTNILLPLESHAIAIQRLDTHTIDMMAAGEVIDSLAAAARELIDNALDAGGDRVTVSVWPDAWRLSVTDNGCGLTESDLRQAALPYTTSKLAPDATFARVATLGFRGEALHSLARVGNLKVRSRARPDDHGWVAEYESSGDVRSLLPAPVPPGTTVTVTELFSTWPQRRTAIGNSKIAVRRLIDVIQAAALAHPHVTWRVEMDEREHLALWSGKTMADVLLQFVPRLERSHLRSHADAGVELVLALPDRYHRPRPDWIRTAVNRRFVTFAPLVRTVRDSFRRTLPRDRHPLCLIALDVPPEDVDWNRHPAKLDLYLQNLAHYQQRIREGIADLLAESETRATRRASVFVLDKATARLHETSGSYDERTPLESLTVIGQLQNTYILVECADGLKLVEQHVADERVRYEALQEQWQLTDLSEPVLIENLRLPQLERLSAIGLYPEPFGDRLWAVRQLPRLLHDDPDKPATVRELSQCTDLEAACVLAACRTAVRNGTPLTRDRQRDLIQAWQGTRNPHTCPHGRPIYLSLNETDLARYFRRHWSICARPNSQISNLPSGYLEPLGDRLSTDIRKRNIDSRDATF
ncbi:MAG: DNA mismatch repair endonuclease MutL [Cyanobacteria bacterium J06642_2]